MHMHSHTLSRKWDKRTVCAMTDDFTLRVCQVRVGKLDVANVSKAIHRYGTIPKGVRIGAYLQSMEHEQNNHHHNDLTPGDDQDSGTDRDSVASCPPAVSEAMADGTGTPASTTLAADGITDDSDPGIKPEHNVRPSTFVKSQSQHGLGEGAGTGMKTQYPGMLQRHKSDLSTSDSDSNRYEAPWGDIFGARLTNPSERLHTPPMGAQPKPSPRFSRVGGEGGSEPSQQPAAILSSAGEGEGVSANINGGHQRPTPPSSFGGERNKLDFSNSPNSLTSFKTFGKPSVVKETNLDLVNAESMLAKGTDNLHLTPTDNTAVGSSTGIYKPVLPFMKGENISAPPENVSGVMTSSTLGEVKLVSSMVGEDTDDSSTVTMERIVEASERLRGCIDKLAVVGNKTSTNFMLLSEEVSELSPETECCC